jgi:tetratricopeptide (TPR) repeat protein
VAQIGAAIGRQFSHELIAAVAPMPPAQLDEALAQLVGAELIYRRGTPPDAEYSFKHALVQDAAYSTMLRSRRQQVHGHIAAILEDRFPEIAEAQPALLAHHCTEAGLTEQAVAYWLAAGRQAWGRSAVGEAAALLRRGLALVPALPDTDWRRERELDLLIALAQTLNVSRVWGAPEMREVNARARELASTLNRPRALFSALWGQINEHCVRGDLKRAQSLSLELLELGATAADVPMQVTSLITGGYICHFFGEFTKMSAYMEEALALYNPAERASYTGLLPQDPQVQLWATSALSLMLLGHLDQGLLRNHAAIDEARRLSHPPSLAFAIGVALWTLHRGVLEHGSLTCEVLALSTEHGLGYWRAFARVRLGWSLVAMGRIDEGIPLAADGLVGWEELALIAYKPWALTMLGDAYRMAGELPAALDRLAEAARLAEETEERWFQAETIRLTGEALLATGDPTAAETRYAEALALAQRQSARLWELCAAMSLARLWRDQGKRSEGRDLLASVYGWFTEGFGTPVLQEAKVLLDEFSAEALRLRPPAARQPRQDDPS